VPYYPPSGGGSSSSAGLAGTGVYYLGTSDNSTWPNWLVIQPGSSITSFISGSNYVLNAVTGGGAANTNIGTGGWLHLPVQSAKLYANTSAARIDAGTPVWRLLFSPTTQQYGVWQFILPNDYSGSPAAQVIFSSDSSLSVAKSTQWLIDQWGFANSQGNIYVDTFGGTNSTTVALSAGYSAGLVQIITVPLATLSSFGAGNLIKLRISSSAGNVTGNQELIGLSLFYRAGTQTIASGSDGLASTGGFFAMHSGDATRFPFSKVMAPGTGITITTDATSVVLTGITKDYRYYVNMRTAHLLGNFASVERSWYLGGHLGGSALSATALQVNSAHCVPYAATRNIKVNSMACNVTIAGSATTIIQLGIYTNSADECLFPFQAVSTSAFLTGSNLGLVSYNPAITLSANNLYWFVYVVGKSAVTMRTIAVAGCWPAFGTDTGMNTGLGLGVQVFTTLTNGLQPTMPGSGNVYTTASPALGIRGSI